MSQLFFSSRTLTTAQVHTALDALNLPTLGIEVANLAGGQSGHAFGAQACKLAGRQGGKVSGLKAGERIVVNGLQRVRPGDVVQPQTVQMNARAATLASPVAIAGS